jgi:hypothetical protein
MTRWFNKEGIGKGRKDSVMSSDIILASAWRD